MTLFLLIVVVAVLVALPIGFTIGWYIAWWHEDGRYGREGLGRWWWS